LSRINSHFPIGRSGIYKVEDVKFQVISLTAFYKSFAFKGLLGLWIPEIIGEERMKPNEQVG
jgi:hypothetical protein